MENALLATAVGIWTRDPSGCITRKPAASGVCAQHAKKKNSGLQLQQTCFSSNQRLNVFLHHVRWVSLYHHHLHHHADFFPPLSICSFHQGEEDGAERLHPEAGVDPAHLPTVSVCYLERNILHECGTGSILLARGHFPALVFISDH